MKSKKKYLVVLLVGYLALSFFNSAWSYDNPGASARAVGMGGGFVAAPDDPGAVFYNPAGLVNLKGYQFYLMYDRKTAYGVDTSEIPYLGVGVITFSLSKDIAIALAGYQDGSWADPTGLVTKNVGMLSLSSWVTDDLSIGFNLKEMYNSNYGGKKGFDFDIGLLYSPYSWLSFGFMGENLARTDMVPDNSSGVVAGYQTRQATFGVAYRYASGSYETHVALDEAFKDVNQPLEKTYSLTSAGIEQWLLTNKDLNLALRAGYKFGKDYELDYNQPSAGGSIRYNAEKFTVQLDYGWSKYPYQAKEDLAGDHRVGLVFKLQEKPKRAKELSSERQIQKDQAKQEQKYEVKKETLSYPTEPAKPETTLAPQVNILTYQLKSETEYLSVGRNRSVMFILNPIIDAEIKRWRLYIWSSPPVGWGVEENEQFLLKFFDGWGNPSFGVMWDCTHNNARAKKGVYYYTLAIKDYQDRKWYSQVKSFKLD